MEKTLGEEKKLYFILSQKGKGNEDFKLEKNDIIKQVEIIKKENKSEYTYILYSLSLSNDYRDKIISLFLIKSNKKYVSSINCAKPYSRIFLYQVDFKPFNKSQITDLNQVFLSYKEQYIIFKKNLAINNDILIKDLCLSSLDYIKDCQMLNHHNNKKIYFDSDFFLYLFIDCLYLCTEKSNDKILNLFFNEFNKDLIDEKNNYIRNNLNKNLIEELYNINTIILLSDYDKIFNVITFKNSNDEAIKIKLDVILAYYYFKYIPKLFINFITKNKRKDEVIANLKKNRKIFNNFSAEVMDFNIYNEAENLTDINSLFLLIPNMPELLRTISSEELFIKLCYLCQIERKKPNVVRYAKPSKGDNLENINNYINKLMKLCKNEDYLPLTLSKEFYFDYCDIYHDDLKELGIIIDILDAYQKTMGKIDENIENEVISYYYETGIYLIESGKLTNLDVLTFMSKINKLKNKKVKLPTECYNSISITDDEGFVNILLNGKFKDNFDDDYINLIKSVLNKLKTLKDFLNLVKWDIDDCPDDEIIFLCFEQLTKVWIKEKEKKLSNSLNEFIGKLIEAISRKHLNFLEELIELEKIINKVEVFLEIYSLILEKNKKTAAYMEQHMRKYIMSNAKEGEPLSIIYKLNTIYDDDKKMKFLEDNLDVKYSVKKEDFINYPLVIEDRIKLFVKLYNGKFFLKNGEQIQTSQYYIESVEAKNQIKTYKYKDAIKFCKNITGFQNLFLYFLPHRYNSNDDYIVDTLLIDFYEICCKCIEQYNSLKLVVNYWKHFFSYTKSNELDELNKFLNKLDETPIIDFNKYEKNIDKFLFYINEAKLKDKLFKSFIFMGLYQDNGMNFSNREENDKFEYTLMRFNELRSLSINSDINTLPNELLKKLVILIYKNNERLDEELSLIKEYFEFDKNEENYFDIIKIKRDFNILVENYKVNENLGDYEMEFNDDFNLIKIENVKNINSNIISTNKTDNEFNLLSNDDNDDNDEFTLFNDDKDDGETKPAKSEIINNEIKNEENKIKENKIMEEKKNELLKEIRKISFDYFFENNTYNPDSNNNLVEFLNYKEKFNNFFTNIFKNIKNYDILNEKEFYEELVCLMTRIFISGVGINIFKKENNKEIYLIYELYEVLEIYRKFHLINKVHLYKIIEKFNEYRENENQENINIINSLDQLFKAIKDNDNFQQKSLSNLFVKLLLMEAIKINEEIFNLKILDLIINDYDYQFLLNDSKPLINEIFKKDIIEKIKIREDEGDTYTYITEFNISLNKIENKINSSKDFEELLLYYFESKINIIFEQYKSKLPIERDLYQDPAMKDYLRQSLNLLEKESSNQSRKKIASLFCISYVKCYLYNYIKYLYKHNQDIQDASEINTNIIKGQGATAFRTSLELYVLKLFYINLGNYKEFSQFNYERYQIDYLHNKDIEKIKDDENDYFVNKKYLYGFDNLFLPINENFFQEFVNIEQYLESLTTNNSNDSAKLISLLNNSNNLDAFCCSIINIYLSNYQSKNYINSNEYKNINKCLTDNLNNFNKINNLGKNLLSIFIDYKNYENKFLKVEDENVYYENLSYNQLLPVLISLRFVFITLLYSNKNGLYYRIVVEGKNIIKNNDKYFKHYYNDKIKNLCEINHLTFTIIRFVLLSHLYFGYLLNNINKEDVSFVFNKDNNRWIEIIEYEFDLIKKIINLKGIKNVIAFMNYIFNDIISIIINIECNNDENYIRQKESNIENAISKYVEDFDYYIEQYNKMVNKIGIKDDDMNEFKKIIIEDKEFYNMKDVDKKYPYISYLTLTNFCSIHDFKNQFNYLVKDKNNYPMINCLVNNLDIVKVSTYLPGINKFINHIYNELVLKIKSEDLDKKINDLLSQDIIDELESFNQKINEINKCKIFMDNKIGEINSNTKISEIINLKNNSIYKFFESLIQIYNDFLKNTKIYNDYKNLINSITLQNASEDDFFILENKSDRNNNDNNIYEDKDISAYDKLQEIICLYSQRNRYNKNSLNTYNINKINYDFIQIEMTLQKEYLYGKKPFEQSQKTFILSNEAFSGERNDLIEKFKSKYPQKSIIDKEEILTKEVDLFLNDVNKTKEIFQQIYINLQYMIIYLMIYDNENYDSENVSLKYISRIIEKSNYRMNENFSDFLTNENIHLNDLLYIYERSELKYFDYLKEEISNEIKIKNISEEVNSKIKEYFKNDKIILNEEIISNSIKRYIMRYCIGDYQNRNEIAQKINFEKILNRTDLWNDEISKNEKFKEEVNELLKMNNDDCLLNYFIKKIFNKSSENQINVIKKEDGKKNKKPDRKRYKRMKY